MIINDMYIFCRVIEIELLFDFNPNKKMTLYFQAHLIPFLTSVLPNCCAIIQYLWPVRDQN